MQYALGPIDTLLVVYEACAQQDVQCSTWTPFKVFGGAIRAFGCGGHAERATNFGTSLEVMILSRFTPLWQRLHTVEQ